MISGPWFYSPDFDPALVIPSLKEWHQSYPESGVFALVAEGSKDKVPDLQEYCRQVDMPLVGAIFPEIIHASTFAKEGVLFIRMDEMPSYILHENVGTEKHVDLLSSRILNMLEETSNRSLFLLFDALVPNVATILDRIYLKLADSVDYTGVNAGSETFQPMPCLFDSDTIIQGGVLALLLPDFGPHMLAHGYPIPDEMITASSSRGNCIQSIDWQPAFEVYKRLAKEWYNTDITPENFYEIAVHFPFGIVLANGEVLIRIPVALSDDGALFCVGEVPENSMLTLMHGPKETLLKASSQFAGVIKASQGRGLIFYCAGRRMHLGQEQAMLELNAVAGHDGDVIGALSLGEIGSEEDNMYPHFHNAALVYASWWQHEP